MNVAAMSTMMSTAKVKEQASLSVMKKVMDNSQQANQFMSDMMKTNTKVMEQSVNSHLGANIDIKL